MGAGQDGPHRDAHQLAPKRAAVKCLTPGEPAGTGQNGLAIAMITATTSSTVGTSLA